MTGHDAIQPMLPLYAAGALDEAEGGRVAEHVRTCEMCRRELADWNLYLQALPEMPPFQAPAGLVEHTRARMIEQSRASAAARRSEAVLLGALTVFGWIVSVAAWTLVRVLARGSLQVFGANLAAGMNWYLVSTAMVWMTAAAAAAVLAKQIEARRVYEPASR